MANAWTGEWMHGSVYVRVLEPPLPSSVSVAAWGEHTTTSYELPRFGDLPKSRADTGTTDFTRLVHHGAGLKRFSTAITLVQPHGLNQWETKMPKDAHAKAAETHEAAAKSHRTAAEHHGKGDHDKGAEHSKAAHGHSESAHKHSTDAHGKSSAHGATK